MQRLTGVLSLNQERKDARMDRSIVFEPGKEGFKDGQEYCL